MFLWFHWTVFWGGSKIQLIIRQKKVYTSTGILKKIRYILFQQTLRKSTQKNQRLYFLKKIHLRSTTPYCGYGNTANNCTTRWCRWKSVHLSFIILFFKKFTFFICVHMVILFLYFLGYYWHSFMYSREKYSRDIVKWQRTNNTHENTHFVSLLTAAYHTILYISNKSWCRAVLLIFHFDKKFSSIL